MASKAKKGGGDLSVRLEIPAEGRAVLVVALGGKVTLADAEAVAADAAKHVDSLEGRPFGLLFDLRKVAEFADDAGPILQQVEIDAAPRGLEAVAHLVAQPGLAKQAEAEMKKLGAAKMIGNFTDEKKARDFASGLNP